MTDFDLRKLNRKELLELLVVSERENEQLKERLQQQEAELQSRNIQVRQIGSLAGAALALNNVFESADKAAAQYLENIKHYSEQQEALYNKIISAAEKKAKIIIENAENEKQKKIKAADDYWQSLSSKLEEYYQNHDGLKEFLLEKSDKSTSENK